MRISLSLVIAAVIGYLIGGILGLVLLAGLAWFVGRSRPVRMIRNLAAIQAQYLESLFAVMGAVCKADGAVTRDEIRVAEDLFERMRLNADNRQKAQAAFSRGKAPDFDLDAELARFAQTCHGQPALLIGFLHVQIAAVAADGRVHPAEHELLLRVARGIGLPDAEVERLEAMLGGAGARGTSGPSLEDAYRILGVSPDASDAEAKKAYRRLMNEHHPDKLAGRGLPESMREMAEERTREIGAAWERIEAARKARA